MARKMREFQTYVKLAHGKDWVIQELLVFNSVDGDGNG